MTASISIRFVLTEKQRKMNVHEGRINAYKCDNCGDGMERYPIRTENQHRILRRITDLQ